MLGWTQQDLADASNFSKAAINNIERRISSPRVTTLGKIREALESAGVAFVEGPGVVLSGEVLNIKKFEGKDSLLQLHEDVLATLHQGEELLISGVNEARFLEVEPDRLLSILNKIRVRGIGSRLLSLEGDTNFIEPLECYRWVPKSIFSQVPYAIYGDKYCILTWEAPRRVVLIENQAIANSFRRQFNNHWKLGKIPSFRKS